MKHGNKQQAGDGLRKFNALVRIWDAFKITMIIFSIPLLYLIQGLIELKDMIVDGEHYLPNGRGRN